MRTRPIARTRRQAAALVKFHEYEGQVWLRKEHGIRARTTRQFDLGLFVDLPRVADVAELYGWDHWAIDDLLANPWAAPDDDDEIELVDEFDIEPEQDEPSIYFNPDDQA